MPELPLSILMSPEAVDRIAEFHRPSTQAPRRDNARFGKTDRVEGSRRYHLASALNRSSNEKVLLLSHPFPFWRSSFRIAGLKTSRGSPRKRKLRLTGHFHVLWMLSKYLMLLFSHVFPRIDVTNSKRSFHVSA